jgi:hypothetical protein
MITSAELARLDVIAAEHRVSRWRVMRLALELLFIEQNRSVSADGGAHSSTDEARAA